MRKLFVACLVVLTLTGCKRKLKLEGNVTGKAATANLTMRDVNATAYERATGKKLGTKAFEASNRCDWEVTAKAGAALGEQDSYPDPAAIAHWAGGFAR